MSEGQVGVVVVLISTREQAERCRAEAVCGVAREWRHGGHCRHSEEDEGKLAENPLAVFFCFI